MSAEIINFTDRQQERTETDDGIITKNKLERLTRRVLKEKFDNNPATMLESLSFYCFDHNVNGNRRTHYAWACELLKIEVIKDVNIEIKIAP